MTRSVKLPHGAKGFDLDPFAVLFCADKIVALHKSTGEHYTLHVGTNSGVLDVHRTWTDKDGNAKIREMIRTSPASDAVRAAP